MGMDCTRYGYVQIASVRQRTEYAGGEAQDVQMD